MESNKDRSLPTSKEHIWIDIFTGFLGNVFFLTITGLGAVAVLVTEWIVQQCLSLFRVGSFDLIPVIICFYAMLCFSLSVYTTMSDKRVSDQREYQQKEADLNAFVSIREVELSRAVQNEYNMIEQRSADANRRLEQFQEHLKSEKEAFDHLISETKQSYPWLSKHIAEMYYKDDTHIAYQLAHKKRAAMSASSQVQEIAKEKRILMQNVKMLEYQLNFYENAFPWLIEYKEIPPIKAWQDAQGFSDNIPEHEYFRGWLSPEEYASLSPVDRLQLKLDRYKNRSKTLWDVGIEYERYIGYTYEINGYTVRYHGAQMGKEDMGRDLIAQRAGETLVIQCKRWTQDKTIHENHVFQLYGSTVLLRVQAPSKTFKGVFITTTSLSELAHKCADTLDIEVKEHVPFCEYPCVKCNIGQDGSKIYHLPFDQQYDRLHITPSKGDRYVHTIAEAEALGFRHAYKWKGSQV